MSDVTVKVVDGRVVVSPFGADALTPLIGQAGLSAAAAEEAAAEALVTLGNVNSAGAAALVDITNAKNTALGAISSAQTTGVAAVNAAGAIQTANATLQADRAQTAADQAVSTANALNLSSSLVALLASLGTAGSDWSAASNGWEATAASPTGLLNKQIKVARVGFDGNCAVTHYVDTYTAPTRVAQPYPSTTSMVTPALTTGTVALSDVVYNTDAIVPFAVNGAADASPKPTAAWVMPFRLLVGDTVRWEMVAFHRDGRNRRQVAAVRVRAVNSANTAQVTPWQVVNTTAISTLAEDLQPIEVFGADLNLTSLPDNILFHLEAEFYPWIGSTASVLSSAGQTDQRKLGPRHFARDTTRAANPPIIYVSPSGNDTTGVCSTNDATAAATPCLTVQGAITKAIATTAVTSGKVDGLRVRIAGAVNIGTHNGAIQRNQSSGAIIIERGTGTARASAVVNITGGAFFNFGGSGFLNSLLTSAAVVFKDVSVIRTAAGQIAAGATGIFSLIQFWNVAFDNSNVTGAILASSASNFLYAYGLTWANYNGNLGYSTSQSSPLFRGLNCPTANVEGVCVIGSYVLGIGTRPNPADGVICYANKSVGGSASNWGLGVSATSAGQTITDVVVVQNLFEWTTTTNQTALRISADNVNGNVVGAVIAHNVSTGFGLYGRWNLFYDESTGTNRRTHKLNRVMGNIMPQLNTKSAIFVAVNQANPTEAVNRHGNWAFEHGVGAWGNWSMFATAAPSSESQYYPGVGSSIGNSSTVRNDPLFVNYQGTTNSGATPVAGAGGGDYRLTTASPARGIVPVASLGFDFAGNARPSGAQDAGLYAVAV